MTTRRRRLEGEIRTALEAAGATAFVHAGTGRDPTIRYCTSESPASEGTVAVAFDGEEWLEDATGPMESSHPAERLARRLAGGDADGTVLTPRHVPHDAAIYLRNVGLSPTSSDVVERARATKTREERERIERVQSAASAGIDRAASILADATAVDGGLEADGEAVTAERLRRAIDEAIVAAGAFPAANTAVDVGQYGPGDADSDEPVPAGEPVVVAVAPRDREGYHGGLVRTFVADGDGGTERRAHVAITRALKSARTLLSTGETTPADLEADLTAEIMAFGFDDGVDATVHGVGLEPAERPVGNDPVEPGAIVRLEAAVVDSDGRAVRLGDLAVYGEDGTRWLEAPPRTLDAGSSEPSGR